MKSTIRRVLVRTPLGSLLAVLVRPPRTFSLWLTRPKRNATTGCSFCGKTYPDIQQIITGPGVGICDRCIRLSETILIEEGIAPV